MKKGYQGVEGRVSTLRHLLYQTPIQTGRSITICSKETKDFYRRQVQYVAVSGNFKEAGYEYTGALRILKVILSYDYLWMNIRVKGGAYGCMSNFRKSGDSFLVSYRDPHLKNTLKIFENTPEYLHTFTADEREMTKYIIGTISDLDVPLNPYAKGELSLGAWFAGITEEELQEERNQILTAQPEDIQALGDW